ncbi:MAG: exopolyphosphatase [Gammaproteobacteria bacterium]|nr:exopolyphosphatase [Gammaproteobacteria bacterium]
MATKLENPPIIAAVDLGSNSFHLTLAKHEHNNLQIIGRLKEKVRLAEGLDKYSCLDEASQERALECLAQFRQRMSGMPIENVRAVGTFTLRKAKNAQQFLSRAEKTLGFPIEIISGHEEARLIYEGVAHFQLTNKKQLVVDIGGGSTEFAIGEAFEPRLLDSLQMGCVSFTQKYFSDKKLSKRNFKKAITAARLELISIQDIYLREGWELSTGTSGTIESILEICRQYEFEKDHITLNCLMDLKQRLIGMEHFDNIELSGLSEHRREILPAGLAILIAILRTLKIEKLFTSPAALREGLLYELTGIEQPFDIKERAIKGLLSRYHTDVEQARRVNSTAIALWNKVKHDWKIDGEYFKQILSWSARCHEVGLSINFSKHQKHGEYIIRNSNLSGFSVPQQNLLALMVRAFRRKFPLHKFEVIENDEFRLKMIRLARLLRLAVVLNHRRRDISSTNINIKVDGETLNVVFPESYLDEHSLVSADLEQEREFLEAVNLPLNFY